MSFFMVRHNVAWSVDSDDVLFLRRKSLLERYIHFAENCLDKRLPRMERARTVERMFRKCCAVVEDGVLVFNEDMRDFSHVDAGVKRMHTIADELTSGHELDVQRRVSLTKEFYQLEGLLNEMFLLRRIYLLDFETRREYYHPLSSDGFQEARILAGECVFLMETLGDECSEALREAKASMPVKPDPVKPVQAQAEAGAENKTFIGSHGRKEVWSFKDGIQRRVISR